MTLPVKKPEMAKPFLLKEYGFIPRQNISQ